MKGSREIGFTVLSMSISLIAVFIPILLMGGDGGQIVPGICGHLERGHRRFPVRVTHNHSHDVRPIPEIGA